jgi:hypothetical protein
MAMLTAYFDESRMDDGDGGKPYPVIGGYVASVENWLSLTSQWRAVLQDNGLKAFHAKDCWANQKEFKDRVRWNKQAKCDLVNGLLDIIQEHVPLSIISTIDGEAYKELTADALADRFHSQYELCGFSCSVLLGEWAEPLNPSPIALVFDQGNPHRHSFEIGHSLVRVGPWPWSRFLGSISFASDERVVPLQAADLYAWSMSRTIDEGMAQGRRTPTVPWSYRVWHDVPRSENYMKRRVLTAMQKAGIFNANAPMDQKEAAKFVQAVKKAKLFENL